MFMVKVRNRKKGQVYKFDCIRYEYEYIMSRMIIKADLYTVYLDCSILAKAWTKYRKI